MLAVIALGSPFGSFQLGACWPDRGGAGLPAAGAVAMQKRALGALRLLGQWVVALAFVLPMASASTPASCRAAAATADRPAIDLADRHRGRARPAAAGPRRILARVGRVASIAGRFARLLAIDEQPADKPPRTPQQRGRRASACEISANRQARSAGIRVQLRCAPIPAKGWLKILATCSQ